MARLFHITVGELIASVTRRLQRARVYFGHGTDNARDEAAALVLHGLKLPSDAPLRVLKRRVNGAARARVEALLLRRIEERRPLAYLTHEAWFAGLRFYVDERVLIPRSAIAELIERRFAPWIVTARVKNVLDMGTGSGCIGLACAKAFPRARVDAADIDAGALEVAAINRRALRLTRRVRLIESDHFAALSGNSYDIIVSNPPYVGEREMRGLPREYCHEPRLALASGRDGLESVATILREARKHLRPEGLLVVEVGNTERLLTRAYPKTPFTWLDFERGGGGVFLLTREQLE
ncbi:MAG TPA: 50S ribosomal protein L3 N(5)-glutamine methyltransferase [Steroidobacteraceae bacterium]|jgi:ribosomal protein L3 glutamine methyltransferase|nr:50S ribosomal protein L3 N(5)-glutamine methyltransferase [Steroidobacteraceae bacterium]